MKNMYLAPDMWVAVIETGKIVCDSNTENRAVTNNYNTGSIDEED